MEEVYISNASTGIPHDPTTAAKQTEIVEKLSDVITANGTANSLLEDIKVLITLPQDLSTTATPTFAGVTLDNVTTPQLEELTDGSETILHSHSVSADPNSCSMKTGTYTGNGTDNRNIDIGIDLASKTYPFVIVKGDVAQPGVMRTEYEQGDKTMALYNQADKVGYIKSFTDVGFIVGTSNWINDTGLTYRYIAFWVD